MRIRKIFLFFIFMICGCFYFNNHVKAQGGLDIEEVQNFSQDSQNLSAYPKAPRLSPLKRSDVKHVPIMDLINEEKEFDPKNNVLASADIIMPEMEVAKGVDPKQLKGDIASNEPEAKTADFGLVNIDGREASLHNNSSKSLDYEVENVTGKTIYIVGFSYLKKSTSNRWRWYKSSVYKLEDNQTTIVNIDYIEDDEDRGSAFGYLGIFDNEEAAQESTFELLDDKQKIDLDQLAQLRGKKVKIEVEKYGIIGSFYDYDFVKKSAAERVVPKLDFFVENQTGKPVLVTCFVYEKKAKGTWLARETKESWSAQEEMRDDMTPWRFDKTSVIKIGAGETGTVAVDTIIESRDREYVRGYLVVFDEDEQKMADAAIYELLPKRIQKIDLGRLINIKNRCIKIYTKKYGTSQFIDYTTQPTQRPNLDKFTKRIK